MSCGTTRWCAASISALRPQRRCDRMASRHSRCDPRRSSQESPRGLYTAFIGRSALFTPFLRSGGYTARREGGSDPGLKAEAVCRPPIPVARERRGSSVTQQFAHSHLARFDGAKVPRRMDHRAPETGRTALLTVTVQEADVFRVRRALSCGGRHSVDLVKMVRVARESRVRLEIGLAAEAVQEAMSKVMGPVSAAEFGRVTAAQRLY